MPTYVWECPNCGATRDVISTVAARNEPQLHTCLPARATQAEHCEPQPHHMHRVITAPMVVDDYKPYKAMTGDRLGKEVRGRVAHKEFLKRNRLVEVGDAPIRSTKVMRKTTDRRTIRGAIKKAIQQHTVADLKRGGVTERRK